MKRNPTVLETCLVYLVSKEPLFSKKTKTKGALKRTHCILKEHQNKKTKCMVRECTFKHATASWRSLIDSTRHNGLASHDFSNLFPNAVTHWFN
jgi:hypothetical protein